AEEELSPEGLRPGEALIRSQYSIISSGTEGAGFTDLVREMPNLQGLRHGYPRRTGHGTPGEGGGVGPTPPLPLGGDRVLTSSKHGSYVIANAGVRDPEPNPHYFGRP